MRKTLWPQSCPLTWYCDSNMCKMNFSSIYMLIDIVTNKKTVLTLKTNWSKIFWKLFDIFIDQKKFNMVSLTYHQHARILIPEMTRYTIKHALIFHDHSIVSFFWWIIDCNEFVQNISAFIKNIFHKRLFHIV